MPSSDKISYRRPLLFPLLLISIILNMQSIGNQFKISRYDSRLFLVILSNRDKSKFRVFRFIASQLAINKVKLLID